MHSRKELCPPVEWRSSSQWGAVIATRTNDGNENVKKSNRFNLVPRFSLLPVERPWLGLVTCLPESGRLQTNDLEEGQISVRFVSAERRQVSGKCSHEIVPGLVKTKPRTPKIMHKSLWQRKRKKLQNIWMLIYGGCFPLQILTHAEEIADSPLVQSKII